MRRDSGLFEELGGCGTVPSAMYFCPLLWARLLGRSVRAPGSKDRRKKMLRCPVNDPISESPRSSNRWERTAGSRSRRSLQAGPDMPGGRWRGPSFRGSIGALFAIQFRSIGCPVPMPAGGDRIVWSAYSRKQISSCSASFAASRSTVRSGNSRQSFKHQWSRSATIVCEMRMPNDSEKRMRAALGSRKRRARVCHGLARMVFLSFMPGTHHI